MVVVDAEYLTAAMQQVQRDLHALALKLEAETSRRHSDNAAVRDAISDMKGYLDKLGDRMQVMVNTAYEAKGDARLAVTKHDSLQSEVTELKDVNRQEHDTLHTRITNAVLGAQRGDEATEGRVMRFLEKWLPLIILGVIATAGYLVVRSSGA